MRVLIYGDKSKLGNQIRRALPIYKHESYIAPPRISEIRNHVDAYQPDAIINCIGENSSNVNMIYSNALFPHVLASQVHVPIYHISTDRVFSGQSCYRYTIHDIPDAADRFGKTRAFGEVQSPHVFNIRCSFISYHTGFTQAVLKPSFTGLKNHIWTGSTIEAIACGIARIITEPSLGHVVHMSTRKSISRYDAARIILDHFGQTERQIPAAYNPVINYSLLPTYTIPSLEESINRWWCGGETPPRPVENL